MKEQWKTEKNREVSGLSAINVYFTLIPLIILDISTVMGKTVYNFHGKNIRQQSYVLKINLFDISHLTF